MAVAVVETTCADPPLTALPVERTCVGSPATSVNLARARRSSVLTSPLWERSWASCRWSGPSSDRRCAVSPTTGVHLVRAGQRLARVRLKPRLTFAAVERSWAPFPATDARVPTRSSHSSTTSSHLRTSGAKLPTTARVPAERVVDFGASGLVRETSCARCPKTAPALERSDALDRRTAPHLETSSDEFRTGGEPDTTSRTHCPKAARARFRRESAGPVSVVYSIATLVKLLEPPRCLFGH